MELLKRNWIPFGVAILMVVSAPFITLYMTAASFAYFLLFVGMFVRKKRPNLHVRLTAVAIVIDLALVLTLEFTRNAIHTALSFKLNYLQQAHVFFSGGAAALYLPIVLLGALKFSRWSSIPGVRAWHKRLGISAFALRSFGYLLMFSMLMPH